MSQQAHAGPAAAGQITAAEVTAFLHAYRPAAFVVPPAYRQQAAHLFLRRALGLHGYQEKVVGGYVVLIPNQNPVVSR